MEIEQGGEFSFALFLMSYMMWTVGHLDYSVVCDSEDSYNCRFKEQKTNDCILGDKQKNTDYILGGAVPSFSVHRIML